MLEDDNITAAKIVTQKNEDNISERNIDNIIREQKEDYASIGNTSHKKSRFKKWLKGKNKQEHIENISIVIMIISAILIWFGLLLGSFIKYTVLLAAVGTFSILIGICIYIGSQMIGEK